MAAIKPPTLYLLIGIKMTRKFILNNEEYQKIAHSDLYYLRESIAEGTSNESEMLQLEKFDAFYRWVERKFEDFAIELELGSDYTREVRDNLNLPEPESPEKIFKETKQSLSEQIDNAKTIEELTQVLRDNREKFLL